MKVFAQNRKGGGGATAGRSLVPAPPSASRQAFMQRLRGAIVGRNTIGGRTRGRR